MAFQLAGGTANLASASARWLTGSPECFHLETQPYWGEGGEEPTACTAPSVYGMQTLESLDIRVELKTGNISQLFLGEP